MFFELIGTLMAGVAAGLIVWAVNRALKGRLPAWLTPVAAGAAMLAATITSEYGWFARTTAAMPKGLVVAQAVEESTFYRPWTYASPFVSRFVAVDRATIRTHPMKPEQRIVDLVFYGRWVPTRKVPVLFDCDGARRADLTGGVAFGPNGNVQGATWYDMPADNPIVTTACQAA
ncbi:MAG: hypothetical protein AAF390_04620 [Pseudomonadota bacterium]